MRKNIYKTMIGTLLAMVLSTSSYARDPQEKTGEALFIQCSACHLKTAQGVHGMFPPLVQRLGYWADSQAGRDYLVLVTDAGLSGTVVIDGVRYTGVMPAQGPSLGDAGIATVLNYLLTTFNADSLPADWTPFSEKEVAAIKQANKGLSNQAKQQLRQQLMQTP